MRPQHFKRYVVNDWRTAALQLRASANAGRSICQNDDHGSSGTAFLLQPRCADQSGRPGPSGRFARSDCILARGRSKDAARRPSHSRYTAIVAIWRRTHSRVASHRAQRAIRILGWKSDQTRYPAACRCGRARGRARSANALGACWPGKGFRIFERWSHCLAHGESAAPCHGTDLCRGTASADRRKVDRLDSGRSPAERMGGRPYPTSHQHAAGSPGGSRIIAQS